MRVPTRVAIAFLASLLVLPVVAVRSADAMAQALMQVPPATLEVVVKPGTVAHAASPIDLARYGYEEQEYFVSGY